ncbi:MAG TPA: hypothetical protein VLG38_07475 [Gammaproteobacteria bacterium]|nr:hypothetical protein [Gammaproteobacteria bacterium]
MYLFKRIIKHFAILLATLPSVSMGATFGMDLLVNGFGTVCASKSDLPKYNYASIPVYPFATQLGTVNPYVASLQYTPGYVGAERRWNFLPNSKFGLQFTALFNDKFKAVTQLLAGAEIFDNNDFYVQMDWAYVQFNPFNELDFQFGRFRLPSFYYSDYLDVNHAQPWVQPPEEVYFIVGDAFQNMDGIKGTYSYYLNDWTATGKLWYGSMKEELIILTQNINVEVRDVIGGNLQIGNDRFSVGGSLMRSIYDTTLYNPFYGLITATEIANGGAFQAAQNLQAILKDQDVPIIYVGLSFNANITDNLSLLAERASIFSRGIISTAREGWYASLSYSLSKFMLTGTYGFSRPLQTEINKYKAVQAFFTSPQYVNTIDKGSGAGQAAINLFQAYLGEQRSLGLDLRYDILASLALKGAVKYIWPVGQSGYRQKYILNLVPTNRHIWVYRLSFDFVF